MFSFKCLGFSDVKACLKDSNILEVIGLCSLLKIKKKSRQETVMRHKGPKVLK